MGALRPGYTTSQLTPLPCFCPPRFQCCILFSSLLDLSFHHSHPLFFLKTAEAEAAALQTEVAREVWVACIGPLAALIASSDDASVQQSAQQLLCQLVRSAREACVTWGAPAPEPAANVQALVGLALGLMRPE